MIDKVRCIRARCHATAVRMVHKLLMIFDLLLYVSVNGYENGGILPLFYVTTHHSDAMTCELSSKMNNDQSKQFKLLCIDG